MAYYGDIRLGDTIDFKFTTVAAATGAPTTLAGSPVISAYPGNSTTELTAGITLTVDFDSRTGMHNVRVVATSGNGYATATNYACVITTGTVGGTSVVGYEVGSFSIENRSAVMPTTAGRTLDVSSTGEAGVDWANVGSPTTTVGLTGTTIATSQVVASVSGAVGSVTGAVGSVTGLTASDVGAIKTKTDFLPSATAGAAGGVFIAGTNAATTITTGLTTTFTGNLTGSVGSVTGAVGSVTGAVGSVTGAVGSVTGAVGSVTGNVGGNVTGSIGSLAAQAQTDVKTQAVAALNTDTYAEPSAVPAATATLVAKIGWLATLARNKITQTATTQLVRNDGDAATVGTSTVSDDGTTYTRGKFS